MRNLRLCDTMLANIQNSIATAGQATYSRADQVAFAYYRGRIMLYQRRLPQVSRVGVGITGLLSADDFWLGRVRQARAELGKAFAMCDSGAWGNGRWVAAELCRGTTCNC